MEKTIPVLVLKHREREEEGLDQRMDEDYINAFVPGIVGLRRQYGLFTNAYIIPACDLLEDQIALLKSRGAFQGKAEILRAEYAVNIGDFKALMDHPMRRAAFLDYVCVFKRQVENRRVWLEAYTVSQHMPMGLQFSMFGPRYGFGSTGSSYIVSPTVS